MLMQASPSLAELENPDEFVARHIGIDAADEALMLGVVQAESLRALIDGIVPRSIARHSAMAIPPAVSEAQALAELRTMANRNQVLRSHIGQGYYGTHTPGVILRNVLENPAWYTAYTPYQAEISQGRMEALVNFQTMVCDLTAMPIANASMLDEASAAAEARTLARRSVKSRSNVFLVSADCHPQTIEVIQTRAAPLGLQVRLFPDLAALAGLLAGGDFFAVLLQYPGSSGMIHDLRALAALVHGQPSYRLALQTREQHIRREKATSNICTAQVLPAVVASMYAVYHGPAGLKRMAQRVAAYTAILARGLQALGCSLENAGSAFDTLSIASGDASAAIAERARQAGVNLRLVGPTRLGIALDETTGRADVEQLWSFFATSGQSLPEFALHEAGGLSLIPPALRRMSPYLTHPVFNTHHSETSMLRYLRRLSDKDLALDRSMIPLGSCTMKLNATSEMIPVTWPEFANIHPFAPADQLSGYAMLDAQLRDWLCQATGYAAISLQPNAGSQGEYAGLLAIRAWHASRGQAQRNICLIPSSAHGTNPASAQMAGMQVVVTACDAQGNVDMADLKAKCQQHSANLAAIMITYPSTHGVFETQVRELCALVHAHGGRVYVDGANMNALVGVAAPGEFGGDVSHLNLHKTFCIPHGGGGPGVGPVCVVADLAPFLPGHQSYAAAQPPAPGGAGPSHGDQAHLQGGAVHTRTSPAAGDSPHRPGAVSAAPLGNAAVLPISWMYCRMMGPDGLKQATEVAILSANYISARLKDHYPTLYASANGHVAHECILDLRPLKESSGGANGISAEDVAKRLMDYGFHAPTLSFPVPGTLMVEPTESETLDELDRFIAAMIAIREEIAMVERGQWPHDNNPLKHAPHTAASVLGEEWDRPYSRETGAFPLASLKQLKYWPPVGRVDNVYGDRNLFCSCVPVSDYA